MSTAKQRRAAAHRKLERQLERRQELERQRKQQMIVLSLIAVVVLIGLVVWFAVAASDDKKDTKAAGDGTIASCDFALDAGGSATIGLPGSGEDKLQTTGTVDLAMSTNHGDLKIQLDRASAPCAVTSFEFLASQNFFDNTICHRLTTGSLAVLQCGDPTGSGSGGPGYHFKQEPPTNTDPYPAGTVAMANTGQPNSTGSQFFICYQACSGLPAEYSVVGKVTDGLQVVKDIAAKGVAGGATDGKPAEEVTITSLAPVA